MIDNKVGIAGFNGQERFEYVEVDDYFPEYITNNLDKWQHMIVAKSSNTVEKLY